jgi:hypothetical protein
MPGNDKMLKLLDPTVLEQNSTTVVSIVSIVSISAATSLSRA